MTDSMTLKVSIFDKVSKILESFVEGPKNGYLVYNSQTLDKDLMLATFAEMNTKDHDKFALVAPDNGKTKMEAVLW